MKRYLCDALPGENRDDIEQHTMFTSFGGRCFDHSLFVRRRMNWLTRWPSSVAFSSPRLRSFSEQSGSAEAEEDPSVSSWPVLRFLETQPAITEVAAPNTRLDTAATAYVCIRIVRWHSSCCTCSFLDETV